MDETTTLQEQLKELQKQNLAEGQAEINAILEKRGLTLVGIPQYIPQGGAWLTTISVGVTIKGDT